MELGGNKKYKKINQAIDIEFENEKAVKSSYEDDQTRLQAYLIGSILMKI